MLPHHPRAHAVHHAFLHVLPAPHHPLTHRISVRATLHHAWSHPALHALCGRRVNRSGGDPDGHSYRQKNSSSSHVLLPPDSVRSGPLGFTSVVATLNPTDRSYRLALYFKR